MKNIIYVDTDGLVVCKSKKGLKREIIQVLLETTIKRNVNFTKIKPYEDKLYELEKALNKWSYYELLGYYQKWKEGFYSFEMIIYILTGFEI